MDDARLAEWTLLSNYLAVGAALFAIGLVGFLARRNLIVMFICAEMMLQGVALSLVAWGRYWNDWGGQTLTIFILAVAACEAGIALALVIGLYHRSGKLDICFWQQLREDNQPGYVDRELPAETLAPGQAWPRLTPAGGEPQHSEDETFYSTHA